LVFGARAGIAAAHFAADQQAPSISILDALVIDETRRIDKQFLRKEGLPGQGGNERIATLRSEMHKAMEEGAGIYRNQASLKQSEEIIRNLQERFLNLAIADRSFTFNTEITAAMELSYMLDVAEAIIQSALQRAESRGSHQRTDHAQRDDQKFLAHSLAYRNENAPPRMEYLPVTITRWPPGERVYGR